MPLSHTLLSGGRPGGLAQASQPPQAPPSAPNPNLMWEQQERVTNDVDTSAMFGNQQFAQYLQQQVMQGLPSQVETQRAKTARGLLMQNVLEGLAPEEYSPMDMVTAGISSYQKPVMRGDMGAALATMGSGAVQAKRQFQDMERKKAMTAYGVVDSEMAQQRKYELDEERLRIDRLKADNAVKSKQNAAMKFSGPVMEKSINAAREWVKQNAGNKTPEQQQEMLQKAFTENFNMMAGTAMALMDDDQRTVVENRIANMNRDIQSGKVNLFPTATVATAAPPPTTTSTGTVTPPTVGGFDLAKLATVESNDDPNVVSPKGAEGRYQIMPATASQPGFNVTPLDKNKPGDDARFANDYSKALMNKYGGDITKALMAWNWGTDNVDKWLSDGGDLKKLPKETREFVRRYNDPFIGWQRSIENGNEKAATTRLDKLPAPNLNKSLTPNEAEIQKKLAIAQGESDIKQSAAAPTAAAETTGKAGAEMNMTEFKAAESAVSNIENLNRITDQIRKSGTQTGLGADIFKNVERVKTLFGSKAAEGKVTDTELLDSMLGSDVFPMIGALGIGAKGMDTPAEREFLRQVMTGTIDLNAQTLLKMTEIRRNVAERAINKWNKRLEGTELDPFYQQMNRKKQPFVIPIGTKDAVNQIPSGSPSIEERLLKYRKAQ
jgi:hypothetical protein